MFKKNYHIKESLGTIETHEVFLDNLAKIKEEELGISEKKFEVPLNKRMMYFLFGFFFFFACILFSKTFYLQALHGNQLLLASENNKGKIALVSSERGIIYDKNFKQLVLNAPAFDLACDKRNFSSALPESLQQIHALALTLGMTDEELNAIFAASEESKVLIFENIPHETLLVLEAKMGAFPYCHIEKNTVRNYVLGPVFSHVLGYTGKPNKEELQGANIYTATDTIGKTGLEKFYESDLRGTPGRIETIKTAIGISKGTNILSPGKSGYNLVLNIDANLQKAVYLALEKSIKNIGSKKGPAVALNPKTGAILALVSYPAYDDNIFSRPISKADFNTIFNDANQPFFNRAIGAKYPTGSTIKPFLASGALQEKLISPDKIINDPGYIVIRSQNDPNVAYTFTGVVPHGLVDMREAIAVSSNIYFYTIGG